MKIRDRVYEVSGTDPVRIYIMGAELVTERNKRIVALAPINPTQLTPPRVDLY
jgi:hypothetical protein